MVKSRRINDEGSGYIMRFGIIRKKTGLPTVPISISSLGIVKNLFATTAASRQFAVPPADSAMSLAAVPSAGEAVPLANAHFPLHARMTPPPTVNAYSTIPNPLGKKTPKKFRIKRKSHKRKLFRK